MSGTFASGTLHKFELSDIVGDGSIDRKPAERAAERVMEHAVSAEDAEMLLEMLGLDAPPVDRCENCGEPQPMIAPQLRWRRARHTRGRKS